MEHLLKHWSRKSRPSLDNTSGITGGSLEDAMWNSAETCYAFREHHAMGYDPLFTP
jgi:hypothetical protein